MTTKCPKCGKIYENAVYCEDCGIKLTDTQIASVNETENKDPVQEIKPVLKTISFTSIYDANVFMRRARNIKVISFNVNTKTRLGLFANHSGVRSVDISYYEYPENIGYQYGIDEEENSHWFVAKGADSSYSAKWRKQNPGREYIAHKAVSHARGNISSLLFGFGNVVEHVTYYVLSRRNVYVKK